MEIGCGVARERGPVGPAHLEVGVGRPGCSGRNRRNPRDQLESLAGAFGGQDKTRPLSYHVETTGKVVWSSPGRGADLTGCCE